MRHATERRPANLRRTLPQWARSPTPEGVQYRLLLPAGPHLATVIRMDFGPDQPRREIAGALWKARAEHAGWGARHKGATPAPTRTSASIPHPLASDSPPETPIAPPEMPPAHDAPASTGQLFLF